MSIEDIRRRQESTTPAPWRREGDFIIDGIGQPVAITGYTAFPARDSQPWHRTNAEFLAHAPQDITDLLEEVDGLREERNQARAWAWSEFHRCYDTAWLPTVDAPDLDPPREWDAPGWLTMAVEPHQQDWWGKNPQ